jgi:hypothetical protein
MDFGGLKMSASKPPSGVPVAPPPPQSAPSNGMDPRYVRSRVFIAVAVLVALSINGWTGAFALLWVPLCAALAVFLCQKHFPQIALTAGSGARIGLRVGAIGFVIVLLFIAASMTAEHFVMHHSVLAELKDELQKAIQSNSNPQAREMVNAWLTQSGLAALLFLMSVVTFFLFMLLGAAGGAVQALILRKPRS